MFGHDGESMCAGSDVPVRGLSVGCEPPPPYTPLTHFECPRHADRHARRPARRGHSPPRHPPDSPARVLRSSDEPAHRDVSAAAGLADDIRSAHTQVDAAGRDRRVDPASRGNGRGARVRCDHRRGCGRARPRRPDGLDRGRGRSVGRRAVAARADQRDHADHGGGVADGLVGVLLPAEGGGRVVGALAPRRRGHDTRLRRGPGRPERPARRRLAARPHRSRAARPPRRGHRAGGREHPSRPIARAGSLAGRGAWRSAVPE